MWPIAIECTSCTGFANLSQLHASSSTNALKCLLEGFVLSVHLSHPMENLLMLCSQCSETDPCTLGSLSTLHVKGACIINE